MDYLDLILTFHQKYAKRWYVINNVLFFRFLMSSLVIVMFVVLYLANHNFNPDDLHQIIGDRYKEYIVRVYDEFKNKNLSRIEFYNSETDPSNKESVDKFEKSTNAPLGNSRQTDLQGYTDLLFDSDAFETLSYEVDVIAPPARFSKRANKRRSDSFDSGEGRELALDDYKIYRNASIYLDIPDYILEEKINFIHRNQEDILRVIYSKSGIIESCYQKAVRRNIVQPGFVKVEFQIASSGYVLPASIRILDSTIRNRSVEQCIKKNIRRWRNFKKLEDNEGIAHVVHKFVFN